jgi:hypothetical protein
MKTNDCWYHNNIIIMKPSCNDITNIDFKQEFTHFIISDYDCIESSIIKYDRTINYDKTKKYQLINYDTFIVSSFDSLIDNLPQYITHIMVNELFDQLVNNLPLSLILIAFGDSFNQPVENLPIKLEYIIFGYDFNCTVDNLPNSIIHIYFGDSFNQSIDNLPNSITSIIFSYHSIFEGLNNLPNSVKITKLSEYCNEPIFI